MTIKNKLEVAGLNRALSAFTQSGVITPEQAGKISKEFLTGKTDGIRELSSNVDLPMAMLPFAMALKNYV